MNSDAAGAQVDLDAAVDQLYAAFAGSGAPADIDYCAHCVSTDEVEPLLVTPLRQLTSGQLSRFALKAPYTWGTEQDLLHFLPRILETMPDAPDDYPEWVLLNKLAALRVRWSPQQQAALAGYLRAWWRMTLARYPSPRPTWDVLDAIRCTEAPADAFLADWAAAPPRPAVRHLVDHIGDWRVSTVDSTGWGQAIDAWLTGPEAALMLDTADGRADDPAFTARLAGTRAHLAAVRDQR